MTEKTGSEIPALAMPFGSCYFTAMSCAKTRRIAALLTAVALAVGSFVHGFIGPDMIAKSAMAAAAHMSMAGDIPDSKCNGCAGEQKALAPAAACSPFCSAVFSLPSGAVAIDAVPAETLKPTAGQNTTGHTVPPDPYPPRPPILS